MDNNHEKLPGRLAWLPIPLLLLAIVALWIADLRTAYESRALMVLLNLFFTWLASLCICVLTGRGFLGSGQPGLLMFGCGSLLWGVTSLAAAMMVERVNATITVHNLGVFGAALCHVVGLLWRGRLARPGQWLVAGYGAALLMAALIFWAAMAGLTPVFFVQGQGGTLVREVVLLLAMAMFAWVAWRLIDRFRRHSGAFYYWYGLGLALVATGLIGVMLLSVQGGILGWTNRLTQYLGSAYLFIAALTAARETGAWTFSLTALEDSWQESEFRAGLRQRMPLGWVLRYGVAVAAVVAAMALRQALTAWVGSGLPPYITFYPMVMLVAVMGGFGPGLVATALAGVAAAYWILPPTGQFAFASPVDRLGLVIFAGLGVFMSGVAEFSRRYRHKAAAYDRETALRESQARLATFAAATFEGIVESQAGRILDCNEQYSQMAGYSVAELKGMEIASLIAPEDRDRVMAIIRQGGESRTEHAMLRKDGTRIVVEVHGQPVSPGSARRHTAIRDITERNQAEEALRRAKEQWERTFDSVPDLIALIDEQHRIVRANRAMAQRLGLTPAQCIGQRCYACVHGTDGPPGFCPHTLTLADGQQHVAEVHEDRLGGDFLVSTTPLRDEQGRRIGSVHVARDITNQRRVETEIRRRAEELHAANEELVRFNRVTVGRELRMIELKKQVNDLCARLGQPPRYKPEPGDEAEPTP